MSATLAARARSDATLSMPPRRAAGRRAAPSALTRLARWFGRRPGRAMVVLLFAAASVAIVLNALVFQKGRHPAPMLSPPSTQSAARPAERRVDQPVQAAPAPQSAVQPALMPPARPGDLQQAAREAPPRPPAAVAPAQSRQAQPAPAAQSRHAPAAQPAAARDPIADLINGSDIRPPAEIRGASAARAPQARRTVEN